ncbi:hypothetical protein KEH51_17420 [[Brevibacterium] frigoritolerans]|uniref:Uncharacterized protein n=1 Tax=Peribacillus frigoritolerans TaxID=450367 RepID=A0A941FJS7_9BACI|nr:hypothetical protein [Peribacillus frigoritolerans]
MGTIRDRGLVKWQAALIMPEHIALNKKIREVDYFLNKNLSLMNTRLKSLKTHGEPTRSATVRPTGTTKSTTVILLMVKQRPIGNW